MLGLWFAAALDTTRPWYLVVPYVLLGLACLCYLWATVCLEPQPGGNPAPPAGSVPLADEARKESS